MRRISAIAAVLILGTALYAAGSEKQPLGFDDFIQIKRVSDPQISPNGKFIAFVVTEMDKTKNTSNSDIWISPLEGGNPWQLTSSPKADFNPRWSPDGKKIAFISTRKATPQIWMIDLQGGEAYPLTDIATGASGVIWSPTGKHLAFLSSVYPDCTTDDCNKKRDAEKEESQVKAQLFDELLFRHWNAWREGKRSHLFVVSADGGEPREVTPGDFDTPPISLGSSQDYAFSPDGTEICFVRNIDPELRMGLGTNNDLFLTPVEGGEIIPITTNKANDNSPHYSPDGRFIAFRAMARPGFEADKVTLILFDRQTQKMKSLTEGLDASVDEIVWKKDSSSIYITYEREGRTVLSRLSLQDKNIQPILKGHTLNSVDLTPDERKAVFLKQSMNQPSEIYALDLASKKISQLTGANEKILAKLEMNAAEEFWFQGAAGDKVHGFLVRPPHFDPQKKYPLVMLIHGGPQGAWYDDFHFRWNAQMFAAPGYVVAMINFHGSTGYGQDFTDSITGDWGGKPFQDILLGLDHVLDQYPFIDKQKLGAAGASYGGYMINWIEGHTSRFNCLISHAGVYDLRSMYGATEELWFPQWEFHGAPWTNPEMYAKWSPSYFVQNFQTPCLVVHGQYDFRVPVTQGFQLFTSLQRMKVPSKFLYFPDEYHFISKPQNAELWWKTVLDWLAAYLK
ncbi:MAG: S9 family peptidase [Candidatus Aminicenantes bacterium]|nr:S9 family peptidase [Candidatus Aminicenantes bacterium]